MALLSFVRRRPRLFSFLAGVLFVFAVRNLIRDTVLADHVVGPLLVADNPAAADAIVVLGGGVKAACAPNSHTLRRVLLGVEAYQKGLARVLVFSGGRVTPYPCVLSDMMAATARRFGVPDEAIRTEGNSTSTWTNAERTDAVLKALGASRVLLITDQLHQTRATLVFERLGYDVARLSVPANVGHTDNVDMLTMGLREYVAIAVYRFRARFQQPEVVTAASEPVTDEEGAALPVKTDGERQNQVIILGASYAADWPIDTLGGLTVVNKGIAGQQSFELLGRFEPDVLAHKPRAVVIWGFINDIFRTPAADVAQAQARARTSLKAMVDLARHNGIEPILATEVTIRGPASWLDSVMGVVGAVLGRRSYQARINGHVMDTNAWLRELARVEGLRLLDFEAALAGYSGQRLGRYAAEDGSHISPAGYAQLTKVAQASIEQLLP